MAVLWVKRSKSNERKSSFSDNHPNSYAKKENNPLRLILWIDTHEFLYRGLFDNTRSALSE